MAPAPLAESRAPIPSPASAALFLLKRQLLCLRHGFFNWRSGLSAYPRRSPTAAWPHVLCEHRSSLWSYEAAAERGLQLGKVQNLRIAVSKLNGVELPSGALFSFWQQIGPATEARGYALGRELREGCLIPAFGGGLCQLSNALYAAAVDCGAEIIERHAHSRVVPGAAAALGRDATVAYNYIDLRFRFDCSVRLECFLTRDELVARFLAEQPSTPEVKPIRMRPMLHLLEPKPTGSCVSCGEATCFRHEPARALAGVAEQTAYLVDRKTPEFAAHVQSERRAQDALFVPVRGDQFRMARYAWPADEYTTVHSAPLQVARHALQSRLRRSTMAADVRAAHLAYREALALSYARKLSPEQTHLVISQDLLPALWRNGHLGGRTFDVLMTRLPIDTLQQRLDAASRLWPESATLGDFRAPEWLGRAEAEALAAASHIVTSHPELARLYGNRATCLPWKMPPVESTADHPRTGRPMIVFPGPTLARKGCYAVREAARALDLEVLLLGRTLEHPDFWHGVNVRSVAPGDTSWLRENAIVVQPALWEESPRVLLRAVSAGIPVIATPGCGLGDRLGVIAVEFGESEALTEAVVAAMSRR